MSKVQKVGRVAESVTLLLPLLRDMAAWIRELRARRQERREARQ